MSWPPDANLLWAESDSLLYGYRNAGVLGKLGVPILDIKDVTGEAWLREPENVMHPRTGSYLPHVGYELCNPAGDLFLQLLYLRNGYIGLFSSYS